MDELGIMVSNRVFRYRISKSQEQEYGVQYRIHHKVQVSNLEHSIYYKMHKLIKIKIKV